MTSCRCGRLIPRWRTWCGQTCRMRFWRVDRRVLDRGPWLPGIVWRAGTLNALPPGAPDAGADGGDGEKLVADEDPPVDDPLDRDRRGRRCPARGHASPCPGVTKRHGTRLNRVTQTHSSPSGLRTATVEACRRTRRKPSGGSAWPPSRVTPTPRPTSESCTTTVKAFRRTTYSAHIWLNLAAATGDENTRKASERVAARMTREQIAEAPARARAPETGSGRGERWPRRGAT